MHLYANAQVGLWFGEFILPDWDMFQSGHPMGALHAAGRAVSGGPVYVSDKPGQHDFDLLRKLVLPDGSLLRARAPGRPTRDCLFVNPVQEPALLKVFNHNLKAGVIGAFNIHHPPGRENPEPIPGCVRPSDVDALAGERFAVYAHSSGELNILERDQPWQFSLPAMTAEVFTIVPVDHGVAPIGLIDLFNSAGAVLDKGWVTPEIYHIQARGPGRFWIWMEQKPSRILVDQARGSYHYDSRSKIVEITLATAGMHPIVVAI
jgi:raffinose synthase